MQGYSCAIVSGGKAIRLNGINKSQILIGKKLLIDRQISVLKKIFDEIIIVSNVPLQYSDIVQIHDFYQDSGPLAGIHAALSTAKNPYTFIFSGDMPFLNDQLILQMIAINELSHYDVIVPRHDNYVEPLHAIYHKNSLPVIESNIQSKQLAIHAIYEKLNILYWELPTDYLAEEVFFNINYPEDIVKANIYANRLE